MIPTYKYSPFYAFPIDLNEDHHEYDHDHDHDHQQLFITSQPATVKAAPSSSSFTTNYRIFINPLQEEGGYYHHKELQPALQHQERANTYASSGRSLFDHPTVFNSENDNGLKFSVCKREDGDENQSANKWMPSKVRMMKKMMINPAADQTIAYISSTTSVQKFEDQKHLSSPSPLINDNSGNSNLIRVCADCNTTKTPLWRSGPKGPKSLCNACGIRQRKARRAMAASANGGIDVFGANPPTMKTNKVQQQKEKKTNSHLPFKKRCKFIAQSRGNEKNKQHYNCFEDLTMLLGKISASQRVFPQDEKEAAILLMALSYGLVHG